MDLRSIKPGLRAVLHSTLVHPRTGKPIEAVGVDEDGHLQWPILGAAEDDDAGEGEGGDDDDESKEGDDSNEDDDDGEEKDPQKKIDALEEEKNRHYKRRRKAEKERDALKAELDALKAKQAKKTTKPAKTAKPDAADDTDDDDDSAEAELKAEREKNAEVTRRLKIENAFLRANTIDWVNPGQVMTLLLADDDYEVEFDDHGNVDRKSLAAELKRFGKANPHLVKAKKPQGGEGEGEGEESKTTTSASTMAGQRKGKGKKEPTREELARKYPALTR